MTYFDTIENIRNHDVMFLFISRDDNNKWITAYVRLENLDKGAYECETFREGNVVGVDTAHVYNRSMSLSQKREDARQQIELLIRDYDRINQERISV